MTGVNPIWLFAWFAVGLITFQEPRAKRTLTTVSGLFTLLSVLPLLGQPQFILGFIGISVLSGLFTNLVYLIGANISRFAQFGKMSPLIIFYFLALLALWAALG